jgi:hypothetical protein
MLTGFRVQATPYSQALKLQVKHLKHEAYDSLPASAEDKNAWSFTSFLHTSWCGA